LPWPVEQEQICGAANLDAALARQIVRIGKKERQSGFRGERFGGAKAVPARGLPLDGSAHCGPGICASERGVAASGEGNAGSGKARQAIEIALVTRFNISLVGIAALGHEMWLYAHRESKRGDPRQQIGRDNRGVFDAVTASHSSAFQRR
jgi:hypothetical protein